MFHCSRYHLDVSTKDDENDNLHCDRRSMNNHSLLNNHDLATNESRKLSIVIHSSNGRAKCRATEKKTLLDETHI